MVFTCRKEMNYPGIYMVYGIGIYMVFIWHLYGIYMVF